MFDEVLYNCCEEMEAPDWSGFSSLELGGGRCFDDGVPQNLVFATEAEFFTVYGRRGEALVPITDCHSAALALSILATLARHSGLPSSLHPSLEDRRVYPSES